MAFKRVLVLIQVGVASLQQTSTRQQAKTFHKIKWANKKRRFTFALACERLFAHLIHLFIYSFKKRFILGH